MSDLVHLILGGARSGKSRWAQRLAEASGRPVLFLATATAGDAEMAERIRAHQSSRPAGWRTIESPLQLLAPVREHARPGDLLLIDCLTLWVSNRLLHQIGTTTPESVPSADWRAIEDALIREIDQLIAWIRAHRIAAILISNEVGLGLVPPYPLGRRYRDALGQVNQALAARADSVILMVAGLPIELRSLTVAPPLPGEGAATGEIRGAPPSHPPDDPRP